LRKSEVEELFALELKSHKIQFEREVRLIPQRKFRWDFVIEGLAIEIQGGTFKGSRGGHTSGMGYQKDCEKMQLVVMEGHTPLYFTSDDVRKGRAIKVIKELINGRHLPSSKVGAANS
jgi:hypothetical protein